VSKDVASFFFVGSEIDKFDETFERLLDGELEIPMVLQVGFQRSLTVKRAHPERLVARFTFAELCRREVGAADFRAISTKFRIIAIEDIPRLNLKYHNEARRFITLVDELYESRCALMCSSVYSADNLFLDSHNDPDYLPSEIEVKVGEAFGIDVAQSTGNTVGELASVRELSFAFRRASSRLSEMCCRPWWDEVLSK
jgi:protein AFG1